MIVRRALQHPRHPLAGTLAGTLAAVVVMTAPGSAPPVAAAVAPARAAAAPGAPGAKSTWTEADKSGFGTSHTRRSNVWFTLQHGRVSEVYYPDLSTPSVRTLELVVTDGATFTDRESAMRVTTSRPDPRSLRFAQVGGRDGRYRLTKVVVTDPRRDAVALRVRLQSLDGRRYRAYVLYDPALTNDGGDDTARTAGRTLVAS